MQSPWWRRDLEVLAKQWDGVCRVILIGPSDNRPPRPEYVRAHPPDVHSARHSPSATSLDHLVQRPRLMPPREVFPPQVINLVIDQLGDAYLNCHRDSTESIDAWRALDKCALVSKKWTGRSRIHLFEEVEIWVPKGQAALTPPPTIIPYIKKLEVSCSEMSWSRYWPVQIPSAPDLLRAFSAAPIESLGIVGGELADQRVCIREFIDAHSSTLQTVKLEGCSLVGYNISDIVLGCHCLKRLRILDCERGELPPPGKPPIADMPGPGAHSKAAELELCISGAQPDEGGLVQNFSLAANLPCRFSRLEFDYAVANQEATEAVNYLVGTNGHTLSSLRVNIWAGTLESLTQKGCS